MSCTILGLGTALPEHAIAQGDAADLARTFCCQNDKRLRLLPALVDHGHHERADPGDLERLQRGDPTHVLALPIEIEAEDEGCGLREDQLLRCPTSEDHRTRNRDQQDGAQRIPQHCGQHEQCEAAAERSPRSPLGASRSSAAGGP